MTLWNGLELPKSYYQDENVYIIHGDCLELLPYIADKSVNLVLVDPPYNIKKDTWDKIPQYVSWCGEWLCQLNRIVADNGSFYLFHNQMPTIAELLCWIKANTKFVFKQLIVWNKRFDRVYNKGFLDGFVETGGLRNYQQMAEYILFYTFQDETGLTTVMLDTNNFPTLRKYFGELQAHIGLNIKSINSKLGHRRAEHGFYWKTTQWDLPIAETYQQLIDKLGINEWGGFREYEDLRREYEDLRREYEDLRYTFNNQKTHHSVWNYAIAERVDHATPKPTDLLENIIAHSSNKEDSVLDPFLGSGSTLVASVQLGRKCIGIEADEKYCNLATIRHIRAMTLRRNS